MTLAARCCAGGGSCDQYVVPAGRCSRPPELRQTSHTSLLLADYIDWRYRQTDGHLTPAQTLAGMRPVWIVMPLVVG